MFNPEKTFRSVQKYGLIEKGSSNKPVKTKHRLYAPFSLSKNKNKTVKLQFSNWKYIKSIRDSPDIQSTGEYFTFVSNSVKKYICKIKNLLNWNWIELKIVTDSYVV